MASDSGYPALVAIGQALASSLELEVSIGRGLRALLEALPCRAALAALPDLESHELTIHAAHRRGEQTELGQRRVDLLAPAVAPASAAALAIRLAVADLAPSSPTSLLTAPIRAGEQVLGLLAAVVDGEHASAPAGRTLAALGGLFGPAVQNARRYEAARAEADCLAAVAAVGSVMRRPLPPELLLGKALVEVLATTDLEFAAIYLQGEGGSRLRVAARLGISRQRAARLAPEALCLQPGYAVAGSSPQPLVAEALQRERAPRRAPQCLMHLPLCSLGRLLGALTVGSYTQRHFAPGSLDVMQGIAAQIALGLDNALLYGEAQRRAAELAQANAALSEALRSKDQFLANVTHELRRPLAPARLVLETLLEAPGSLTPQRQARLLRNALDNLDSLNALVSELLDAVRIERHLPPPRHDLVDLIAVTRQALATLRPLAEKRGLRTQLLAPAGALTVCGDAQGLGRVATNLLANACKFNRDGGSILVQLERADDGRAVLSVTDTGTGIPEHARTHIFERFYQADASSTRAHEGLGLGLYIAKEIVEQHGGTMRFDSEEGVGTTFTVTLPLA
ncbi:MAG TPA: ATP-binding protein [Anaerolineae bacterium]|nr:ATP-binding protein [Anaerolineae bacterium]HPL29213.1 ATP-binding protein [Anaerolineae bacterium]